MANKRFRQGEITPLEYLETFAFPAYEALERDSPNPGMVAAYAYITSLLNCTDYAREWLNHFDAGNKYCSQLPKAKKPFKSRSVQRFHQVPMFRVIEGVGIAFKHFRPDLNQRSWYPIDTIARFVQPQSYTLNLNLVYEEYQVNEVSRIDLVDPETKQVIEVVNVSDLLQAYEPLRQLLAEFPTPNYQTNKDIPNV